MDCRKIVVVVVVVLDMDIVVVPAAAQAGEEARRRNTDGSVKRRVRSVFWRGRGRRLRFS
jgi:hypothetical protein